MGRTAWLVLLLVVLWPASAAADDPTPEMELEGLEHDMQRRAAELASDCTTACKALESMIRSADRICELDDGERCAEARRKVAEAKEKVREACPDCAAAQAEATRPSTPVDGEKPHLDKGEHKHTEPVKPAAPPPAAPERRGCAACSVGSASFDFGAFYALGLAAVLVARRFSRDRSRRTPCR